MTSSPSDKRSTYAHYGLRDKTIMKSTDNLTDSARIENMGTDATIFHQYKGPPSHKTGRIRVVFILIIM